MNKTIKIISTLIIAILLVTSLSQVCLAVVSTPKDPDGGGTVEKGPYIGIIGNMDNSAQGEASEISELTTKAGQILKVIRNIAAIIAVIVISILGIKYMMGSTQERADYKKSFIPLVVGIVVVVAATTIASAIFNLAK